MSERLEMMTGPAARPEAKDDDRGQALAEYGLILALVFAACVIALGAMGLVLAGQLGIVADAFP